MATLSARPSRPVGTHTVYDIPETFRKGFFDGTFLNVIVKNCIFLIVEEMLKLSLSTPHPKQQWYITDIDKCNKGFRTIKTDLLYTCQ